MDEKQFDTLISQALSYKAGEVKAPAGLQSKIKEDIKNQSKEDFKMRKGHIRKVILIAAAFCILGTAAAIAAGRTTSLVSHSGNDATQYTEYGTMLEQSKTMGFPVHAVEKFDNGFTFKKASIVKVQGMDDQGNDTVGYDELSIEYRNGDDIFLNVSINRTPEELAAEQKTPVYQATKEIKGVCVGYKADRYKFLPPDGKPSEEDLQAEARGELFISYGSQEEENKTYSYVTWVMDGVDYIISSFDADLSADDMFVMAEVMLAGK